MGLCQIIDDLGLDIVCITETWLDDSIPNLSDIPDGYKIIRKDRTEAFKVEVVLLLYTKAIFKSARKTNFLILSKTSYGYRLMERKISPWELSTIPTIQTC